MTKIYLDMDGVLVDFDKGLLEDYGIKNDKVCYGTPDKDKTPEQWVLSKAVWDCMNKPDYFYNLPPMDGYEDLWDAANRLTKEVYILTAFPKHGNGVNQDIGGDKWEWLQIYLPGITHDKFIFCERQDKKMYANGNILIDDLPVNCSEWEEAGGYPVLFQDTKQAIWDMEVKYGI